MNICAATGGYVIGQGDGGARITGCCGGRHRAQHRFGDHKRAFDGLHIAKTHENHDQQDEACQKYGHAPVQQIGFKRNGIGRTPVRRAVGQSSPIRVAVATACKFEATPNLR